MYIETKIHEYSLFVGLVDQRVRVLVLQVRNTRTTPRNFSYLAVTMYTYKCFNVILYILFF